MDANLGEQLKSMKDDREEAKDHDENAIGVYKINAEAEDLLVGHIPCEISKPIHCFLKTDKFNFVVAIVTGKRKERWAWLYQRDLNTWQRKKTFAQGTGEGKK